MPRLSADEIDFIMQQGGWALLRFRVRGHSLGFAASHYEVPCDPVLGYGYVKEVARRSPPTAFEILVMDETCRWLGYVADPGVRRIVALRALYDDDVGRCLNSYSRIAQLFHSSVYKVRLGHLRGLREIARGVNGALDGGNLTVHRIVFFMEDRFRALI